MFYFFQTITRKYFSISIMCLREFFSSFAALNYLAAPIFSTSNVQLNKKNSRKSLCAFTISAFNVCESVGKIHWPVSFGTFACVCEYDVFQCCDATCAVETNSFSHVKMQCEFQWKLKMNSSSTEASCVNIVYPYMCVRASHKQSLTACVWVISVKHKQTFTK